MKIFISRNNLCGDSVMMPLLPFGQNRVHDSDHAVDILLKTTTKRKIITTGPRQHSGRAPALSSGGHGFESCWMMGFSSSIFPHSFTGGVSLFRSLKEAHLQLCAVKEKMPSCAALGETGSISSDWVLKKQLLLKPIRG